MTSATFAKMLNKTKQSELDALHAIASSSSSAEAAESRKNADLSTNKMVRRLAIQASLQIPMKSAGQSTARSSRQKR